MPGSAPYRPQVRGRDVRRDWTSVPKTVAFSTAPTTMLTGNSSIAATASKEARRRGCRRRVAGRSCRNCRQRDLQRSEYP